MATVIDQARRFRVNARRRTSEARARVVEAYAAALRSIEREGRRYIAAAERERAATGKVSELTLRALREYGETQAAVRAALLRAGTAGLTIAGASVRREIRLAERDARSLLGRRGDPITDAATVNLTGLLARGPLRARVEELAGADADAVMEELRTGIIRGRSPHDTIRAIEDRVGGSSEHHMRTVVTTETYRARREAQRQVWIQAGEVAGWTWVCSLTPSSCGYCWRQHGRRFLLAEVMATHPNCSCEMAPWSADDAPVDQGVDLFDALTDEEQDQALGSASAGRAYRDGAVTLEDLCRTGVHPTWGPSGSQVSLRRALGAGAEAYYPRAMR